MLHLPLSLCLLAAAPAAPKVTVDISPEPPKRLHPRRVTASSFLKNGWNQYEQNYLPPYAADDDALTAWVEGVDGNGEGQQFVWMGPTLKKAKALRLYVRNGYQKSQKLFAANARPKRVKLEPVKPGEVDVQPAGTPIEVTLQDKQGWQEITLPTDAEVAGFRLSVLSVYPGTKYTDTCISDVRVYAQADDPYRADMERAAMEDIRRFVAERKSAEKRGDKKPKLLFPSGFTEELVAELPYQGDWAESLKGDEKVKAFVQRAKVVEQRWDEAGKREKGKGWRGVEALPRYRRVETARVAFAGIHWSLADATPYFHLDDLSVFDTSAASAKKEQRAEAAIAAYREELVQCEASCEAERKGKTAEEVGDCDCASTCTNQCYPGMQTATEIKALKGQAGSWAVGSVGKPDALLHAWVENVGGEREGDVYLLMEALIAYEGNLAQGAAVASRNAGRPAYFLFDWTAGEGGKAKLSAVTEVWVGGNKVRFTRYVSA